MSVSAAAEVWRVLPRRLLKDGVSLVSSFCGFVNCLEKYFRLAKCYIKDIE